MIYVQFGDATEQTIVSVFYGPQDPDEYPNQGQVNDSDKRYIAFVEQISLILIGDKE